MPNDLNLIGVGIHQRAQTCLVDVTSHAACGSGIDLGAQINCLMDEFGTRPAVGAGIQDGRLNRVV